jgi:hypothetical protein
MGGLPRKYWCSLEFRGSKKREGKKRKSDERNIYIYI